MMTKAQFRRLLDAHGADASRLPAALRDEAEAYLATDPAAAGVLRDAERPRRPSILVGFAATWQAPPAISPTMWGVLRWWR